MSGMDRFYKRQKEKQGSSTTSSSGGLDRYYKRQYYNSLDISNVNEDFINSFITDAKRYLDTAESDFGSLGWSTASSAYDNRNNAWSDLNTRYDTIKAWLYKNESNFDRESYKSFSDALDSYGSGAKSVVDTFKSAKDFYSQFDTEDAYNEWYKAEEEKKALMSSEDFEYYSQIGANIENPTYAQANASDNFLGWKNPFKKGEEINNIVTFSRDNAEHIEKVLAMSNSNADLADVLGDYRYRFMEDDEVAIYNYYLGKGDTQKASEYLSSLDDVLNQRYAGEMVKRVDDTALELVFSAAAGLDQFASGVKNLDNFIMGTEADKTSAIQYAHSAMSSNNEGIWGVANDLVSTTTNMLPSILVSTIPVVGKPLGLATMGTSVVGNSYAEMRNLGYSDWQARGYATLVGAAETGLQALLGGISKLGGKHSLSKAVTKLVSKFDNALAKVAIQVPLNMASEGLEESLQTVLEPAFKALVTGEDFEGAEWDEILYSGLIGALSAGFLEGVPTVAGTTISNIKAKNAYGDGSDLVSEALGIAPEGSELRTLAEKYKGKLDSGKSLSGGAIIRLDEAIRSNDVNIIKKAALGRLGELGETTDVTSIAEVLTKYAQGEKLTSKDYAVLNNSDYGQQVLAEMNPDNIKSGGLGNKWAENIGTRRIAPDVYNKEYYNRTIQAAVNEAIESGSVANTIAESETATGANVEVSESGKTVYYDAETGSYTDVNIKQVVSTKGGLKVELDNGKTVSAKDLRFSTKEEGLMYEMIARMEVTPETANELISTFKPKNVKQASMYFTAVPLAYQYGKMGYEAGLKNIALSEDQKRIAYNRGRMDAITETKSSPKATTSKKDGASTKKNGIIFEDGFVYDESTANELQKASMIGIEVIAKMSSLEVHVFRSKVENGKRVAYVNGKLVKAPNGYFTDGNKIYIDFESGNGGEGAMLYTMSHEVTHYIRKWNAKGFKELGDFLIAEYGKQGVPVNALLEAQKAKIKKRYKEEGKTLPSEAKLADMAYEELVADAMSDMFTDPKAFEKLAKLKQKNHTLWEKLGEAIKALLDKLKTALGIYKTKDPAVAKEAMFVRGFSADVYEKLQDLYLKAFVEADANYEAFIGSRNLNDFADAKNENGEPLFQYRAMEADEDTYRDMLHKWGKMTDTQIDNLFNTIDTAMELIKDNLEVLDYAWEADIDDRAFSPVKPNSDKLYQVSLDFSTLCRKRILQQTVQAQLQEALNKPLSREEGIAIRDALMALQEEGRQIEVACALCYVESARMKSPEQIKKFINNKEKVIKDFFANKSGGNIKEKIKQAEADARARLGVGNASLKSLPGKVAQEIRDAKKAAKESYKPTAEEQKLIEVAKGMTVSDFTSPEGLENLAKKYPRLFDAYTSYIRNATKSKGIENDTWWRAGDSNRIGDVLIANMNKENGLRTQSWSDFQVIHILDYIASTIELATRNTKAQAYSKVPDYVELMGSTGVLINMSLIPTATFNGSLDYDSVEGIDYKRALELRDKYHATAGTICIGVDNVQIKLLLADATIDYVIPYHRSGMSKALRKLMHIPTWSDYELYQSESNLSRADAEKQAKKYGVKLLDATDPNYQKGTSFSEWFDIKEAQQIAKMENANPSDKAKQKKYGVMYGGYMAMQNAANNYLKLCAERGIAPKFSHEKADFTAEENYWKLLIDRKMVDNVTGEVIEQQTIKPIFNEGEIMRVLNDELARYPKVKEDQDYAIRRVTEKMLSGEIKGGMSAEAIAKVMKKPVDNVTNVNILASAEDVMLSDRDSSYEDYSKPISAEDVKVLRAMGNKSINGFTSEDIKATQKWAYKFYKELGAKSPFFRAWFGDWRAYDLNSTKVIDATRSEGKNPRGKFLNRDTGWEINSSSVGYDETVSHSGKNKKSIIAMQNIDKIIENAILLDTEVSEYGRGKKSVYTAFMHKFYALCRINGKLYIAKMAVDESYAPGQDDTNKKFYHVRAIEIETASSVGIGESHTPIIEDTVSDISIADLFKFVKSCDDKFNPTAVNPLLLNEDGTPKVFYHGTSAEFSVFDIEKAGQNWHGDSRLGKGFYFANTEHEALQWTEGTNVVKAYLNLKNPLNVDAPTPKNIAKEIDKHIANKIASFDENNSFISKEQYIKNLERIKDMYMNDVSMFIDNFKYDDNGKMTDGIREFLSSLGYDGIISKDEVVAFYPEQIKSATDNIGTFNKAETDIHYSDRDSYAPTFYSHMGKVVDGIKIDKMGANGVVSYLKGKGVKDEEIKWSGIETFLEGKKSVTKTELQEFVAKSQLRIEETTIDNTETPMTKERKDKLATLERERSNLVDKVKSEWKRIFGTDELDNYAGESLPYDFDIRVATAVVSKKSATPIGQEYKAAQEAMKQVCEESDYFGYDSAKQAYVAVLRDPADFLSGNELTASEEAAIRRLAKAKEAWLGLEGVPASDVRYLKDLGGDVQRIGGKITDIRIAHSGEQKLPRWGSYKLKGGENYREIVFKMPGSDYTNAAMEVHWGGFGFKGVLAHARIQEFNVNGKRMLFIEEIQSDWHNEGHKRGYESDQAAMYKKLSDLKKQWMSLYEEMLDAKPRSEEQKAIIKTMDSIYEERETLQKKADYGTFVPDAPFSTNYHEYVLKRLLRMAAEEGYDSIGWTPAEIQDERWADKQAHEEGKGKSGNLIGYTIEYDQEIPKFLRKYGKRWGATVGSTTINDTQVWSMDITDTMKESVLTEGQPLYSDRDTYSEGLSATDKIIADRIIERLRQRTMSSKYGVVATGAYTADRIERELAYSSSYGNPDYANSYIAWVSPEDFIYATTGSAQVRDILTEEAGSLDVERLSNERQPIYLLVDFEKESIIGHEGRHRMIALQKAGVERVAVVIEARNNDLYNTKPINMMHLEGQYFNQSNKGRDFYLHDALPLSNRYASVVTELFSHQPQNGVRFSDRDPDAVSNRTLLANALESVAKNDIEKTKLAQYKSKIELIEKEYAKLNEIKAEAQRLRFLKGRTTAETKRLHDLDFEANQISNRISTYDKQLLNLESTSALKNVLEREKTMLRKRLEQKSKDAIRKQKEKDAVTIREIMTRHTESRKKAIEGRHKTEMRHKIKKVVNELNQLLLHGSKERNVKLGLQQAVASALDAINMDTVGADERIAKYNALIAKATDPDVVASLTESRDRIQAQGDSLGDKLKALKEAYYEIQHGEEGKNYPTYFKEEASLIEQRIQSVIKEVGNTSIRNMSLKQLTAVYDMYTMVLTTIRNANSVWKDGKIEDLRMNASAVMQELEKIKKLKGEGTKVGELIRSYSWNEMIPYYAFDRIGSETLMSFFMETIKGQNTYATDVAEAKEFSTNTREKYGYKKWDLDKVYEFKLKDGRTFQTTLKHMLSIYAYSKRDQALSHMSIGGFFFNDKSTFRKKGGILELIKRDDEGYKIDAEILAEIKDAMTKDQLNYVDEMQEYLTKMGEKGNEVTRILWGIDIFTEKVYFPLKSKDDFIKRSTETAQSVSLKNDGMTKETVPGASNPIVLEAFDDVWASHIDRMSQYHAFVIPIDNLNKMHQYGTWSGTASMSVSTMLTARFGSAVNEYISQFIKDLNGNVVSQGAKNPLMGFFSKFKKTAVGASLSTVAQQPTAILRAMAVVDAEYFVGKPNLSSLSKKWAELKKYAPIAIIKDIGGFDAGSGVQVSRWLNSDALTGVDKVMNTIDDISMKGAEVADQLGWTSIWEAVKREVKATTNLEVGSEAFLKKAGERFTEVIVKTQVYDSTLSRSGFMRSKSDLMKMLTSFMGEPTLSINMMFSAVVKALRGGSKAEAARVIGFTYASIIAASAMASLIYALRDDDEDESYLEKYMQALGGEVISDVVLAPITSLPAVKDIASIFQGWDVERTDVAIFKDIKDAFDGLDSENKSAYRKIEDLAGAMASAFGIPLKNLLRTGREIYNAVNAMTDGISGGDIGGAFVEGVTGKEESNTDRLYDAIISGDQNQIDRIKGRFKDEKAIENAMKQGLRENDSRIKEAAQARYEGNISEYARIAREIIAEGKFSQDIVVGAINAEISAIKRGEPSEEEPTEDKDEVTSIYSASDMNTAFNNGDTATALEIINDLIETKVANGKTEKEARSSLRSSMTSYWKPLYKQAYQSGDSTEMARIRQLLYASGLYGSGNEVVKTVQSWLKD